MSRYRRVPTAGQQPHPPAHTVHFTTGGEEQTVYERVAGREYYESGGLFREWIATRTMRAARPARTLPRPIQTGPGILTRIWRALCQWATATFLWASVAAFELLAGWIGYRIDPFVGPLVAVLIVFLALGWMTREEM